ncbi:MAG TPA: DciA family protein [Terriglobales bacterium]|nr:DciA family protein [Terriglobales bacterium]
MAWPLASGHAVSKRTRALDFAKGILPGGSSGAGWRAELQSLAPQYVAVINRYAGESVSRIEFVISARGIAGESLP